MVLPVISIVVPGQGDEALLRRCLEALTAQTLAANRYEIIVVEEAIHPATQKLLAELRTRNGAQPQFVHVCSAPRAGIAASCNAGWRNARGAVVGFIGVDGVAHCGWLAAGLAIIEEGAAAAVGRSSSMHPIPYAQRWEPITRSYFSATNLFVHAVWLRGTGGFDERFVLASGAVCDLLCSVTESGGKVSYCHDARVAYQGGLQDGTRWLNEQRRFSYDALLYKRHPALYRRHIHRRADWRYYTIVFALLSAASALIFHDAALGALGIALWLALTFELFQQRWQQSSRQECRMCVALLEAVLLPPVAVFWRVVGAITFRALPW